jgi:hypothetical protein
MVALGRSDSIERPQMTRTNANFRKRENLSEVNDGHSMDLTHLMISIVSIRVMMDADCTKAGSPTETDFLTRG